MDVSPHVELKRGRFRDPEKFAPVVFVSFTIVTLYSVFMFCHCLPSLQVGVAVGEVSGNSRHRAILQAVFFNFVTLMVIVCYVLSIIVHPGTVPDAPEWEVYPEDQGFCQTWGEGHSVSSHHQETKRTGDRRSCKWCHMYKPDRSHHCRVCRMCILKMDHHCPWIYNCVGFHNYKYFFLLLVYAAIDLHFVVWSMGASVLRIATAPDVCFLHMCFVLFGETLAIFLGALVTAFLGFHSWLTISGMSTIEFCEKKKHPKKGQGKNELSNQRSVYNLGVVANFRETLGCNLWAMLIPIPPKLGDGLSFVSTGTRLTADLAVQDVRRRTHQVTQRTIRPSNSDSVLHPSWTSSASSIPESPRTIRPSNSDNDILLDPWGLHGKEGAEISIVD